MDQTFQHHLEDILMDDFPSGGKFSSAGIFSHDGGSRAQSADFPEISDEEWSTMMGGLDDPNSVCTGLKFGGTRYMLTPSQAGYALYARTLKRDAGVVIRKTWQSVVVCVYAEPVLHGEAIARIESYADNLEEIEHWGKQR